MAVVCWPHNAALASTTFTLAKHTAVIQWGGVPQIFDILFDDFILYVSSYKNDRDQTPWISLNYFSRDALHASAVYAVAAVRPSFRQSYSWAMSKLISWSLHQNLFRAECANVTDRRTDGRTDTAWRHRPRLCIASRGKKQIQRRLKPATFNFTSCLNFPFFGFSSLYRCCQFSATIANCW